LIQRSEIALLWVRFCIYGAHLVIGVLILAGGATKMAVALRLAQQTFQTVILFPQTPDFTSQLLVLPAQFFDVVLP
jgi:hypothetical protein